MTSDEKRPEETGAGEPKFRERRSAFKEDDGETRAPAPADPEEVGIGEEERPSGGEAPGRGPAEAPAGEPVIETPPGAGTGERAAAGEAGPETRPEPGPESGSVEPGPAEPGPEAGEIDLDRLDQMEIPEPSFFEIVQPLEIQALQFLGVVPLTEGGEKRVLPRWAKHVIDLLGLIEERTRGNLSDEEKRYLETVLTELRTRYLQVSK